MYDVLIIGAGCAGTSAALLAAQQGLRVCLIEKQRSYTFHKILCTHMIKASAIPVLQKLNLLSELEHLGAVRSQLICHSPYGEIKRQTGDETFNLNITRDKFDPLLRAHAIQHPNIDYFPGCRDCKPVINHNRVEALVFRDQTKQLCKVMAGFYLIADGSQSAHANCFQMQTSAVPIPRIGLYAYFNATPHEFHTHTHFWIAPDMLAYLMPNNDNRYLLSIGLECEKYDRSVLTQCALSSFFKHLSGLPKVDFSAQLTRPYQIKQAFYVKRDCPLENAMTIGDAAMTVDVSTGFGIAWALRQADKITSCIAQLPHADIKSAYQAWCKPALETKFQYFFYEENPAGPDPRLARFMKLATEHPKAATAFINFYDDLTTVSTFTREMLKVQKQVTQA